MKPNSFLNRNMSPGFLSHSWMSRRGVLIVSIALFQSSLFFQSAYGVAVSFNASDALGTTSFNTAGHWSSGAAPSAGNTYVVGAGLSLRTPSTAGNFTFAGDTLTISGASASLNYKGTGNATITVNDLQLGSGGTVANATSNTTATFAGNITLLSGGGIFDAVGDLTGNQRQLIVTANLTGSGALTIRSTGSPGGVVTLSGANSNTGPTGVSGVNTRLQVAKRASLYSGNSANWTAANITVNNTCALGLNVGGTGEFTESDLITLLSLGATTGGFQNGSFVAIDTSNAAGGNFTYGNTGNFIANTRGGANVIGLTKLGANTLTLISANTYTGATTITGGTLQIGNGGATGALSASSAITNNGALVVNLSNAVAQGTDFSSAAISGSGSLTQAGSGLLTLNAANTYTGATTVSSGTLSFSTLASGASAQNLGGGNAVNLGVASTSSGVLKYTGAAGTLDKNVNALGNGTNTIQNGGTGLLTLSGTLTKNGTILALNGGGSGINVTGAIVGSNSNSDLHVSGGLVTLSATNSYNGPTLVYGSGTLALGISNAIPSNSSLTLGDGTSAGVFNMAGYTNAIGSLAFGGGGGTVMMAASGTSAAQLSAAGTVALGSANTLDLSGMGTTAGLYKLISGSSLSGTFGTVSNLNGLYTLKYSGTELDAQHKARISLASGTNAANVHVGSQTVNFTIGNSAPSQSADLNYTLTGLSGSGTRVASAGSSAGTGTYTASAGVNSFNIVANDSNASNTGQSVAFSQTGYRYAAVNALSDVSLGNFHVGKSANTTSVSATNTAVSTDIYSEKLDLSGSTTGAATFGGGASLIAAGSSTSLTIGVTDTAGAHTGTVVLSATSDGNGTSNLGLSAVGSQTINVTGTGYRFASANTLGDVSFGNFHVGATLSTVLSATNTAVNDAYSEKLTVTGSATGVATVIGGTSQLAAGSSTGLTVGLANTAGAHSGTVVVGLTSDGAGTSGLGTTALTGTTINVTGTGYRLASANTLGDVSFGKFLTGTTLSTVLSATNTAASDGFSEKLTVSGSATGAASFSGSATVVAGSSTSLTVGLANTVGVHTGTVAVNLVSDGAGTSGLGTTALTGQTVNVSGTGYDRASLSQAQSTSGNTTTINLDNASGAYRAGATVSAVNLSQAQAGFSTSNFSSTTIASGTSAAVAQFDITNKLNGTYKGTLGYTAQNDASILGSGTGDLNGSIGLSVNVSSKTDSGAAQILAGGSYKDYGIDTSAALSAATGHTTTATILGGTNTNLTAVDLTMTLSNPALIHNSKYVSSNAVDVTGINGTMFVLQLTYDTNSNVGSDPYYIGWYDAALGHWVNAIGGNSNSNGTTDLFGSNAILGAYNASTDYHLGLYGFDSTTNTAWAVVDHNSEFAVIPEPSTWAMMVGGFGMLISLQRLRKKSS